MSIAVTHKIAIVRRRAISIARHANIMTFPQTFIHNLHKENERRNKLWGIKVAALLLEDADLARVYTRQHMDVLMRKIRHQLQRNRGRKHSDPVKRKLKQLADLAHAMKGQLDRGADN